MTAKVILFDFDGTIADTYQAIAKITNQLSTEFGYKALNQEELVLIKNLSSREIVRRSEISIFKLPFLVRRVRAELSKEIAELENSTLCNIFLSFATFSNQTNQQSNNWINQLNNIHLWLILNQLD